MTPVLPKVEINEILRHIPHRYPFLLIDRVEACEPGKWIRAIKNVTATEWFFNGAQTRAVIPQVLVIEALAQAGGALCHYSETTSKIGQSLIFFAGIDNVKAVGDAYRGDTIILECKLARTMRGVAKLIAKASVRAAHLDR